MIHSTKFIYRYLHKYYSIILYIFFSIIIIVIIWKGIIQFLLETIKNNLYKTIPINQHALFQVSETAVFKNNYNNDDLIYLDILKKQSHIDRFMSIKTIYSHLVASPQDQLNKVLKKHSNNINVDSNDIQKLLRQYPILNHLQSGQTLYWFVTDLGKLECLIRRISPQEIRIYNNVHNFFKEGIIKVLKKSSNESFYMVLFVGELTGTFVDSAYVLGLEKNCVIDIVRALQFQLDFKKLHQGDRFSVLVSSTIINNNVISKLIGVRIYTAGKNYYMFRANNGKFYNQEAIRFGKKFIYFPVSQPYRISSNFNLNRLNPITKRVSPHAGVDFAVPIGTPVLSVGDGEVIVSKYSKIAGNYVVIKHNHQCITRYMHLKTILVKLGQKVKKGDHIALSGNTGRSTGPHLHFEIWVNHRPVNPLIPNNILNIEKLSGNERIKYLNQIHAMIPKLSFD